MKMSTEKRCEKKISEEEHKNAEEDNEKSIFARMDRESSENRTCLLSCVRVCECRGWTNKNQVREFHVSHEWMFQISHSRKTKKKMKECEGGNRSTADFENRLNSLWWGWVESQQLVHIQTLLDGNRYFPSLIMSEWHDEGDRRGTEHINKRQVSVILAVT